MWQLEIYPSLMEGAAIETYKRTGSLAQWLKEAGIEWETLEHQPIIVTINGNAYPTSQWKKRIKSGSVVKIRVVPYGFIGKLIGKILGFIMKLFGGKPKTQSNFDSKQSKSLETVEASNNRPKLGEVVPEIIGTFRKYPDYLVQPHRYYVENDPRVQILEFQACVGPGEYVINPQDVKVGNTAFSGLGDKGEYVIYQPGANLQGISTNTNWYNSPEVGATSSGNSGIDLNSEILDTENKAPATYTFSEGNRITRSDGIWPVGWEVDTIVRITKRSNYTIKHIVSNSYDGDNLYTVVRGDFKHLSFLAQDTQANVRSRVQWLESTFKLTSNPIAPILNNLGPFRLQWVDEVNGIGELYFRGFYGINNSTISLSFYDVFGGFRIIELISSTSFRFSRVWTTVVPGQTPTTNYSQFTDTTNFRGFTPAIASGGSVSFITTAAFGVRSVNFSATPGGEYTNKLELDFFFASGLCKVEDSGALSARTVRIEVVITDIDSGQSVTVPYTFTAATVDQIGYTKTVQLGPQQGVTDIGLFGRNIRPLVSARRITAASTSTSVNDKITWQGLKSLLTNVNSYPNWTTIGFKLRSGGKLSGESETQINVIAQRKIEPVGGGLRRVSSRIEDYVRYIATTAGYQTSDLDIQELIRLGDKWLARGDFINHIFDETTVREALVTTLAVGYSDLTIDNGRIRPVRDEVRTVFEHAYSPQNMLEGGLERQFKTPRPDDIDGVEVDYMDTATWTRRTVVCTLPDSPRIRLRKVKIDGVSDRTRAWRMGMRQFLETKYRVWGYAFSTELDAMCSNYLSYVPLYDEIPKYSQTAFIVGLTPETPTSTYQDIVVNFSEPIKWDDYIGSDVIASLRSPEGIPTKSYAVTKYGDNPYIAKVRATNPNPFPAWLLSPRTINQGEPIHSFIGVKNKIFLPALITEISPSSYNNVNVKAVNYDARVYENDDKEPPLGA